MGTANKTFAEFNYGDGSKSFNGIYKIYNKSGYYRDKEGHPFYSVICVTANGWDTHCADTDSCYG